MYFENLDQAIHKWENAAHWYSISGKLSEEMKISGELKRYMEFFEKQPNNNISNIVSFYLKKLPTDRHGLYNHVNNSIEDMRSHALELERELEDVSLIPGSPVKLLNFPHSSEPNLNTVELYNAGAIPRSLWIRGLTREEAEDFADYIEVWEPSREFVDAATDVLTFGEVSENPKIMGEIDENLRYGMFIRGYPFGGSDLLMKEGEHKLSITMDSPLHLGEALHNILYDERTKQYIDKLVEQYS